ncbi:hypothetical protein EDD86DRAFT_219645 [Gorgonomyces haynaldii]|nr:hypothetical protein EDD86DRAFT_219645 [Gorgonomyces haynaldii]
MTVLMQMNIMKCLFSRDDYFQSIATLSMAAFLLPPELIAYIGGFLSVRDFLRLRRTCRLVNRLAATKQVTGEELQEVLDTIRQCTCTHRLGYALTEEMTFSHLYHKITSQFTTTPKEVLKIRFASLVTFRMHELAHMYLDQRIPDAKETDTDMQSYTGYTIYGQCLIDHIDGIPRAFDLLKRLVKAWGIPDNWRTVDLRWMDYENAEGDVVSSAWELNQPEVCRFLIEHGARTNPEYQQEMIEWAYSH